MEGAELLGCGKRAEQEKMDDFFEDTVVGEILNGVASVIEPSAESYSRNFTFSSNDTGQTSSRALLIIGLLRH